MIKNFKSVPRGATPKSRHMMEEFGPGKKALEICRVCGSIYYKKSWHHPLEGLKQVVPKKMVLCPADQMIKNRQYEGKIIIQKVPAKIEDELIKVIKNSGSQAFSVDPMDKIIAIKKEKDELVVTTTENEMANKMARKIKGVFKKVNTKITFSGDPSDVVVIKMEFFV